MELSLQIMLVAQTFEENVKKCSVSRMVNLPQNKSCRVV